MNAALSFTYLDGLGHIFLEVVIRCLLCSLLDVALSHDLKMLTPICSLYIWTFIRIILSFVDVYLVSFVKYSFPYG